MIYILVPILLLAAFVLLSQWRTYTPPILGSDGQPLPNSIASLASAIQMAIADTSMRQRASSIGKAIRAEDGVENAVKIVRQYLGA
ncbi:MAG: hypothetical protein MUO77_10465, partial [Anaerolineales bacterium]|nr:hypothetical protein [Anaerolineales bacterium]